MKTKSLIVIAALASFLAIGCKSESERKWEDAKDSADRAVDKASDALHDAKDATKEAAREGVDKVTK